MILKNNFAYLLLATIFLTSCVTARKFEETEAMARKCEVTKDSLFVKNDELQTMVNELSSNAERDEKRLDALMNDTTLLGGSLRTMRSQYDKINELNEQLLDKNKSMLSNNESEKKQLLEAVLNLQKDLGEKEKRLDTIEKNLDQAQKELDTKTMTLEEREKRVAELEKMIADKDKKTQELKEKISKALLGFENKGLTVQEVDGRIHVSMEAKLLFDSGSTEVQSEGKKALRELAKAIQNQKDLTVLVEGHTDSDKIGPSLPFKDNWDLSVLRATSVVRILLENNNLDPKMLSASGRSEYLPVDEEKAKNRRIEVILIPDLNAIFNILEQ